jgi:putative endonuclease
MTTKERGDLAEEQAVKYLIKHQFNILEQNYFSKMGEIDIIAFKDQNYHFIEVKSGNSFEPVYNITPGKLRKIIRTAERYLQQKCE